MAALKQARLDAGLTQTELADRLERPQSFVAKYENGERRVEVVEFVQIVRAIGCDGRAILDHVAQAELGADTITGGFNPLKPLENE
jgi:transcriptional regulator with XRE-family HTH domain